ncbi:hypothetical protein Drose_16730 [Dactylosporangium roseum]|uniref:ABM domain-containing protein n=1 Tax=Dactylosporangium roseum TaxID=47989 RepID=A0ABY5ZC57_9ACTN|nr:antibiotic biosynthesis monooxygenase [Dactylosporangium roseum]UWZ39713.1 hypothetical protein Drose_16730 [Dactylosporangium roseum]
MLRAIHYFGSAPGSAVDTHRSSLPEEVEATSFVSASGFTLVLELWPTETGYAEHSFSAFESGQPFWQDHAQPSELYPLTRFTRTDGVWHPIEEPDHRIGWGNSRPVRVLYAFSAPAESDFANDIQTLETLREPGCEQFEYFVSVEDPARHLLLELWGDQYLYDRHWDLRLRTGTPPTTTLHPTDTVEFYRFAQFDCSYGWWHPTAEGPDLIPGTVRWLG